MGVVKVTNPREWQCATIYCGLCTCLSCELDDSWLKSYSPSQAAVNFRSRWAKCRDLGATLSNNRGLARCYIHSTKGVVRRDLHSFRSIVQLFIAGKAWSRAIIGEDHRRYGVQKLVPPKKLTWNVLVDWFCKVFIRYIRTRD